MTSTWPEKRAFVVSLIGLFFQAILAAFLGVLAAWNGSESNQAAAILAACGIPIWVFLALVYKQRLLVREEVLESEQLRQERAASGAGAALFADEERLLLARRRLRWMYRWLLPFFTVVAIVLLAGVGGTLSWSWDVSVRDKSWPLPTHEAISFAFVLGAAFGSFLLSRYMTGMARQPEWRMLRAGAAYLMGNTLAGVAVAALLGLVYFQMPVPERVLAYTLRTMMVVLAAEFLLNFVLDFYRPRRPDEDPRPAFDSRLLGLFCEPGGIAHSIAEAMNYQFGFEVSSTWFYKLMQRAITPILCFGVLVLFSVSCLVIVEAGDVAIVERFGRPLQTGRPDPDRTGDDGLPAIDALGPGLHLKWPWPIDIAYHYPARRVQEVTIGVREEEAEAKLNKVLIWTEQHPAVPELTVIVATSSSARPQAATRPAAGAATQPGVTGRGVGLNLLRMAVVIQYRIRDVQAWRERFADPASIFESLAFRAVTERAASVDVDQAMGDDRSVIAEDLRHRIQKRADALNLGVAIVTLGLQGVHPPNEVAAEFEAVIAAQATRQAAIRAGEAERNKILSEACGSVTLAEELIARSNAYNDAQEPSEKNRIRATINDMLLVQARGRAAKTVAEAQAEMWATLLAARTDADTLTQELPAYRAAPRIYRARKYMDALTEGLRTIRKYLVAMDVDPIYQLQLLDPTVARIDTGLQGETK